MGCDTLGIPLLSRNSPLHLGICSRHCTAPAPPNDCDASLERCHPGANHTACVGRPHKSRCLDHSECCHDGKYWSGYNGETKRSKGEWINTVENCGLDLGYGSGRSLLPRANGALRRLAALPNNTKHRGFVEKKYGTVDEGGRTS